MDSCFPTTPELRETVQQSQCPQLPCPLQCPLPWPPPASGRRRQAASCTDTLAEGTDISHLLMWVLQMSTHCRNRKSLIWVKFSLGLQGWSSGNSLGVGLGG